MSVGFPSTAVFLLALASGAFATQSRAQQAAAGSAGSLAADYREVADRLIDAALADSFAFERLTEMVDRFGHRFSGSENLELALDWILAEMEEDGLENVRAEHVPVPHWVRGEESLELVLPRRVKLPMLGLGSSIGTPPEGIRAGVLVVSSFDELEARHYEARGKIVLLNAPFTSYGKTVTYRVLGAVAAALVWLYLGAFAILLGGVVVSYTMRWRSGRVRSAS